MLEVGEFSTTRTGRFTTKGRASWCPLKRKRLSEPQCRSGLFGEQIHLLSVQGINPRFKGRPARRVVAMSVHTPIVLKLPDCWLEVSIRKVLRPTTSTQFFFVSLRLKANAEMVPNISKLPLHASHVALPT